MKLRFSGAPEVAAPLANVWPRIVDPLTGFGVNSIRLRFGNVVELTDVSPPNYFTMKARGRAASIADAGPLPQPPPASP